MTDIKKGLTWSSKWHIVDEARSAGHSRSDVSLCGAHLYSSAKDRRMPSHLQRIIDGTAKSTGDCKMCARIAGRKTPDQILDDEDTILDIGQLIYDRSQMTLGDAEDLAHDIFARIKEQL